MRREYVPGSNPGIPSKNVQTFGHFERKEDVHEKKRTRQHYQMGVYAY